MTQPDRGATQPVPPDATPPPSQQYGQPPQQYGQPPQQYGQPPQPYGQDLKARETTGVEGWRPPVAGEEVGFGRASRWAIGPGAILSLLAGAGIYAILVFFVNLLTGSSAAGDIPGDVRLWALIPAVIVFVVGFVWSTAFSLACLGLLRLSRGYRQIGAVGQGLLAWLTGAALSTVGSVVLSPFWSISGDTIARLGNR